MRYLAAGAASRLRGQRRRKRFTTLDAYAKEQGIARVGCIKLNIEGAELAALDGAASIIRRDKPLLIASEPSHGHLGESLRASGAAPRLRAAFPSLRARLVARRASTALDAGLAARIPGDWGMNSTRAEKELCWKE